MKEYAVNLGIMLLAVTLPIHQMMIATGVLIAIDTFTGIYRSVHVGEKITSRGFRRTISKLVLFQIAIITAFVLEKFLLGGFPATNVVAGVIGLSETKSILENVSTITGLDFWSAVLEKLNGKKEVEKETEKKEKTDE